MRKLIDKLLRLLLLILLLILAGLGYLLLTESGSRNLEKLAMHYFPQLEIENPTGRLLGDYSIGRLGWKEDAASVEATQLHLQTDFSAIFRAEIRVLGLEIETLALDLHPTEQPEESAAEEPPSGFSLPIDLALDQLRVKRLELGLNGQQYALEDIRLAGVMSGSDISGSEVILRSEFEGRPIDLTLSGDVGLAWPPAFGLEAAIEASDPLFGAVDVAADLEGTLHDYRIAATIDSQSESLGSNSLRLAASGNEGELEVESAHLEGDNGAADLSGTLQWQELLAWQAELAFADLDSTRLYPDYPAKLSGRLITNGRLEEGSPQVVIVLQAIEGLLLNQYPLSAGGEASYADKQLEIRELEIAAGDNLLRANGRLAETFDLEFDLEAHHPEQLVPQLEGELAASGRLGGSLESPLLTAEISAGKLAYQDYALDTLALDLSTEGGQVTGTGQLRRLKVGDQQVSSAEFEASGTLQEHRLDLTAVHDLASVTTAVAGGWRDERWQGDIEKLEIDGKQAGRWRLRQPVAMKASTQLAGTDELCLESGSAALCADFQWESGKGMRSAGNAKALPLQLLDMLLPPAARLRGTAGLDYTFRLENGTPGATATLNWDAGKLILVGDSGDSRTLGYDAGKVDALLENEILSFNGGLVLPGYASVDSQGEIRLSRQDNRHTIDASLKADAPDLTWLDEFIPEARLQQGSFSADATVSGLLATPALDVAARLQKGQLLIERTGETLDDITLNIKTIADNRFGIDGSLKAGKGTLTVNGDLKLSGLNWATRLEIKGSQLALLDSHEIKVQVAPDILVEASQDKVVMSGTLLVPEAAIRLVTLPKSAVVESEDVVIVGSGGPQRRSPGEGLGFEPRLKVVLGDKVTFSGYGLEAGLKGEFRLTQLRGKLITDGFLSIHDGLYKIYGQTLEIDSGRLIFNGPLDNPGIDIRIVRKLTDVTVGLNVSGTLQTPESSVYSTPVMSETEAFSYLLTGRSLSGASAAQGAMLMSVAKSMGLLGGESFVRKLGSGLGLDEATITTEGGFEESELLLGKRIGENLYVKYIMGLVDSVRKLALEYRFTERLRVEAETGSESSADLIYRIERD